MSWLWGFYGTSVGKKVVMAATGALMALFVLGHMVGNLQVFAGPGPTPELTKLNEYAQLLRKEMPILWTVRIVLLAAVTLHVVTGVLLTLSNWAARPVRYSVRATVQATWASRTMIWGGIALGAYVFYHILHLTTGSVHKGLFVEGDVYANVVRSFRERPIAGVYVVAAIALFLHLQHGILSLFQTLGVSHPGHLGAIGKVGWVLSVVIAAGFVSVPLGITLGFVK